MASLPAPTGLVTANDNSGSYNTYIDGTKQTKGNLYWDSVGGASGYNVYRDGYFIMTRSTAFSGSFYMGRYEILPGRQYYFQVSSLDGAEEGPLSAPVYYTAQPDGVSGAQNGDLTAAILLVRFDSVTEPAFTNADAELYYFAATESYADYISECSYGRVNWVGDVYGWLDLPEPYNYYSESERMDAIEAEAGIDFDDYRRKVFLCMGDLTGFGTPWANPKLGTAWPGSTLTGKVMEEIGHCFMGYHMTSVALSGVDNDAPPNLDDPTEDDPPLICTANGGNGVPDSIGGVDSTHNALNRSIMGFLEPSQVLEVCSTQQVELYDLNEQTLGLGVRLIYIPLPDDSAFGYSAQFVVEYRKQTGWDGDRSGWTRTWGGFQGVYDGMYVYLSMGHNSLAAGGGSDGSWNLKHQDRPSYSNEFRVTESFVDSYTGVTIEFASENATSAVINITRPTVDPRPVVPENWPVAISAGRLGRRSGGPFRRRVLG